MPVPPRTPAIRSRENWHPGLSAGATRAILSGDELASGRRPARSGHEEHQGKYQAYCVESSNTRHYRRRWVGMALANERIREEANGLSEQGHKPTLVGLGVT